jgi:hypothetical protein
MRPTLTEAHWKKAGSLVQGWGAVQLSLSQQLLAPVTWGERLRLLAPERGLFAQSFF